MPKPKYKPGPKQFEATPQTGTIPNALVISQILAPVDEVARQMEAKWGVDRLPALVPIEWAQKFGKAQEYLNDAIEARKIPELMSVAEVMIKAWRKLDDLATEAGSAPFDPTAWAFTIGKTKACIVRDPSAAANIQKLDPECAVYTLAEIGRIIEAHIGSVAPTIAKIKGLAPGAEISKIEPRLVQPERSKLALGLDDEIPF